MTTSLLRYVGFCPVCGQGLLGVRMCSSDAHAVVMCLECDATWLDRALKEAPLFPRQPDLPCPNGDGWLRLEPSHWADAEEVAKVGWTDAVVGVSE